jgi:hypothetical protein
MTYFILRHRSTGKIMPTQDRGAGATWWEPTLEKKQRVPRLFLRKIDAINAQRWWAEGPWQGAMDAYGEGFTKKADIVVRLPRDASHLEIIPVELKFGGQIEMRL